MRPSFATTASCGKLFGRGRSYSVITTFPFLPFGRGNECSSKGHCVRRLRLTDPKYAPNVLASRGGVFEAKREVRGNSCVLGARYPCIRVSTSPQSAAPW